MSAADEELTAFCERTYPRLVGALDLYLGGDLDLAEELVQEALIEAVKRWPTVRDLDSPAGWAYRVAVNRANSWFRRKRAERRAYTRVGSEPDAPRDVQADVADRKLVREAVRDLPEGQRDALVLRYYLGLSGPEAADRLEISHDAVRARTKRAVANLRDRLGPDAIDREEAHDVA